MDIQKVASVTTATAVLGTGAFVGGNHQIDKMQGGPEETGCTDRTDKTGCKRRSIYTNG